LPSNVEALKKKVQFTYRVEAGRDGNFHTRSKSGYTVSMNPRNTQVAAQNVIIAKALSVGYDQLK